MLNDWRMAEKWDTHDMFTTDKSITLSRRDLVLLVTLVGALTSSCRLKDIFQSDLTVWWFIRVRTLVFQST